MAAAVPMDCPLCHRRGRFASNAYELAKRFPNVMAEGVVFCHICHKIVVQKTSGLVHARAWYCSYCEICICPECQPTRRGT